MTTSEILAGLRQAAHVLQFVGSWQVLAAVRAAIDLIEAVNP